MQQDTLSVEQKLEVLREQHRDLDAAVDALEANGSTDLLQIKRLKKRKLQLKDDIRMLSARALPDIIA